MSSTSVWELAETTNQPLEVVIFQAVAYKAWNPGGHIDNEWARALTGVLSGSHPWRRAITHHPGTVDENDAVDLGSDADQFAQLALDSTEADPGTNFAAAVLAQLGQRIPTSDRAFAERLVRAGLGDLDADGFLGYPDEAPTWSQLAHGAIDIEELDNG